jgi:cation transport ATPase
MRSPSAKKIARVNPVRTQETAAPPRSLGFKNVDAGPVTWRDLNRVVFVAAAAVLLWLRRGGSHPYFTTLGMICALVGSIPVFQEAYESISQRRTKPAIFFAAAILAAVLVGKVFVALVIVLFGLLVAIFKEIVSFRGRRTLRDAERCPRNPGSGKSLD